MGESIERQLGRMEAKLDELLEDKKQEPERRKFMHERIDAVDARVDVIEKWQVRIAAAATAVGALFMFAYTFLKDFARHG